MRSYVVRRVLGLDRSSSGPRWSCSASCWPSANSVRNLSLGKQARCARPTLTEQFHLNDPFIVQYLKYMGRVLTGDFGFAGKPVSEIFIDGSR